MQSNDILVRNMALALRRTLFLACRRTFRVNLRNRLFFWWGTGESRQGLLSTTLGSRQSLIWNAKKLKASCYGTRSSLGGALVR